MYLIRASNYSIVNVLDSGLQPLLFVVEVKLSCSSQHDKYGGLIEI